MKTMIFLHKDGKKQIFRFSVNTTMRKDFSLEYDFSGSAYDNNKHEVVEDISDLLEYIRNDLGYDFISVERLYTVELYLPDYTYTHEVTAISYADAIRQVRKKTDKDAQIVSVQAFGDEKFKFDYKRQTKRGRKPEVKPLPVEVSRKYKFIFTRKEYGLTVDRTSFERVCTMNDTRLIIADVIRTSNYTHGVAEPV